MANNHIIESGGFYFIHNFDSGNLGHVERVPTELITPSVHHKTNAVETPDYEFNLWTRPDCAGTEFENGNRTWFYFGMQGGEPGVLVRLNLINLNKQGKMYNQGMAPVTRMLPGKPQWERIRDKPVHSTDDNTFTLSFKYRTPDNLKATSFFAFTYPFSFAELQIALNSIDLKLLPMAAPQSLDDIYYCRECLVYSLEGRRVDLLTISSHHGMQSEKETRLKNLFPDKTERPFKFANKKVIFISARVHPGETPSSFVFNGFLNLLLTKNDPIATMLRKMYVFKMVPFLNPDGVARGHYRTDTRGVNLNRVYLNPSLHLHPTVFASRALIRYYHYGQEREDTGEEVKPCNLLCRSPSTDTSEVEPKKKKPVLKGTENNKRDEKRAPVSFRAPVAGNKAPGAAKASPQADCAKKEPKKTCDAALADQVSELKLQEMTSQTSQDYQFTDKTCSTSTFTPSLLDDAVLRERLGFNLHLSTSEELKIPGPNPLRSLRDTLKDSISLLIGSTTPSECGTRDNPSPEHSMKVGWCRSCREALAGLEHSTLGLDKDSLSLQGTLNESEGESEERSEQVMLCTNCFKRFLVSDLEQEVTVLDNRSTVSIAVSAGDSGDIKRGQGTSSEEATADSTGDTLGSTTKDAKPKSAPKTKKKSLIIAHMSAGKCIPKEYESGLYLYIDLHGHASKKGIFMYGNHFEDLESSVECMLLPRIMSLNNLHFHFSSCNFTERNMYLKDRRDGMSREGSGRVAVLKATGLVRSYTLECNYNTGRLVNVLPPTVREGPNASASHAHAPPKYTPHIFEEVGRSLGASILDLTGHHPNSRIPCSEHRNLSAVRDWLRAHTRNLRPPQLTMSRLRPKTSSPTRAPLYARSLTKTKMADVERKENTYIGAKPEIEVKRAPAVRSGRSNELIAMRFTTKKTEKTFTRSRYLGESEPKPKTLSTKRRNILAIRKPNASKARSVSGVVKAKNSRRTNEEMEGSRNSLTAKHSKGGFPLRQFRREGTDAARPLAAVPSSSSEEVESWEDVSGAATSAQALPGKRRPYPHAPAPAAHLKKIRLKTNL